jgi:CheY-like chemotaxis protein
MRRASRVARPLVLITDDDRDSREMFAVYLNMNGYNVKVAKDGQEAVRKARTLLPDVIVMDLEMPKLDGWGAMRELRSRPETAAIPIIILTGHDLKDYLDYSAISEGAAAYLMKPLFPEQLAREISTLLAAPKRLPRAL